MPSTMQAVQVSEANAPLRVVDLPQPSPGPGHVRIAVEACGVCRTDGDMVQGVFGNQPFPLTPGHEIAGRIDMLGEGVEGWELGERVAVGWFGGNDGTCEACREGDAINCEHLEVPGLAYPGGYAESVVVPTSALARIPDELTFVEAAPMGCAGVTVFAGLRSTSAQPGDLVGVLGIGGLGHLAVQFADKMGFDTVAIARGGDKEESAQPTRRTALHRRRQAGHGPGTAGSRRSQGCAGDRRSPGSDVSCRRWPARTRRAGHYRRLAEQDGSQPAAVDRRGEDAARACIRNRARGRGDDAVRRAIRGSVH